MVRLSTYSRLLIFLAIPAFGQYWYAGNNTYLTIPYPATPTPPAARNRGNIVSPFIDSTLTSGGVPMWRLTDENFTPGPPCGLPLGSNWQTSDDPENIGWNIDGTMFFAHNSGNTGVVWVLNRSTGDTTLIGPHNTNDQRCGMLTFSGSNYAIRLPWNWSSTLTDRIYGVNQPDCSIRYLDVLSLGTTSTILTSFSSNFPCANHPTEYVHDALDKIHAFIAGGLTDKDVYVAYYDASNGQKHILSTVANTIDGVPFASGSDTFPAPGWLHQVQIDPTGNYLVISMANAAAPNHIYSWNLTTNLVKQFKYDLGLASGHRAIGTTYVMFDDFCQFSASLIQWAVVNYTTPSACTSLLNPPGPARNSIDMHASWQTRTDAFPLAPIFWESFDQTGIDTEGAFMREMFMMDPAGKRVVRIAKSWCKGSDFSNQCSGQIDPTGNWIVFKSNWNKTLLSSRMDVFLAKLPVLGSLPTTLVRGTLSGRASIQ